MKIILVIYYLVLNFIAVYVNMNVAAIIFITSGLQKLDKIYEKIV